MKIGFIAYPASGHLYPMTALARKLQARGHKVICIGIPDAESIIRAAGLAFVPYCEQEFPAGSLTEAYAPIAKMHGMEVVTYTCEKVFAPLARAAFKNLPRILQDTGIEALVMDPIHFFLELVPISMSIPYVQVCCALHLDASGTTPPFIFNWPHETTPEAVSRNVEGVHQVVQHSLRY